MPVSPRLLSVLSERDAAPPGVQLVSAPVAPGGVEHRTGQRDRGSVVARDPERVVRRRVALADAVDPPARAIVMRNRGVEAVAPVTGRAAPSDTEHSGVG